MTGSVLNMVTFFPPWGTRMSSTYIVLNVVGPAEGSTLITRAYLLSINISALDHDIVCSL